MNRTDRQILRRAASMLLHDARLGRESCSIGSSLWACGDCVQKNGKCEARREHDARIKSAGQLKSLANT